MQERLRFQLLRQLVETNKIKMSLDRRKSIEHYNNEISEKRITLSFFKVFLYYLSQVVGLGLFIGIYCVIFVKPYYYGLIIILTSVYLRYQIWKYLKNIAMKYVKQKAMKTEDDFVDIYQENAFSLFNTVTGKKVCYPEKWTIVLPKEAVLNESSK